MARRSHGFHSRARRRHAEISPRRPLLMERWLWALWSRASTQERRLGNRPLWQQEAIRAENASGHSSGCASQKERVLGFDVSLALSGRSNLAEDLMTPVTAH